MRHHFHLAVTLTIFAAGATEGNDSDKLRSLVNQAWSQPRAVGDMRVKIKVNKRARGDAEVRRLVTEAMQSGIDGDHTAAASHHGHLTEVSINALEEAIKIALLKEGKPSYHSQRYRVMDYLQRIDTVEQDEDTWGHEMPYSETRINGKRHLDGTLTRIDMNHQRKTCTFDYVHDKPAWGDPGYLSMVTLDLDLRTLIRVATGRRKDLQITPRSKAADLIEEDSLKTESFINGAQSLQVAHRTGTLFNKPVDQIDFMRSGYGPSPLASVYCDANQPARIVLTLIRDKAGKVIRRTEASDFIFDGLPRFWRETVISEDGTEESEEREILEFTSIIDDLVEVFEPVVPAGYLSVSVFPDKRIFQLPDGTLQEEPNLTPTTKKKESVRRSESRQLLYAILWLLIAVGLSVSAWTLVKQARKRIRSDVTN